MKKGNIIYGIFVILIFVFGAYFAFNDGGSSATPSTSTIGPAGSAIHLDTSKLEQLDKAESVFTRKDIDFDSGSYSCTLLTNKSIDYISLEDAYEVLKLVNSKIPVKFDIPKDVEAAARQIFDINNDIITAKTWSQFYLPTRFGNSSSYYLENHEGTKVEYITHVTKLSDFGTAFKKYNDRVYFPVMLMNYAFFADDLVLCPDLSHYVINSSAELSTKPDIIRSYLDYSDYPIANELLRFSATYLNQYLKMYYPYMDQRPEALLDPAKAFGVNKDMPRLDYIEYAAKQLDQLRDYHTMLYKISFHLNLPVDSGYEGMQNYFKYTNEVSSALEKNSNFTQSEYKVIDNSIGYLRIHSFNEDNQAFLSEIPTALESFANTKAMIIDLRYNKGGYIDSEGPLLSSLVKENGSFKIYYNERTSDTGRTPMVKEYKKVGTYSYDKPVILLTNRFTYSAGNIFTGFFKDNKLGTIIGEKTSGGGSPRGMSVLPDGTAFFTSFKEIYTHPDGTYYEQGIEPDITVQENLTNGSDAILERAVQFIETGK